jgi:hypothetical protein
MPRRRPAQVRRHLPRFSNSHYLGTAKPPPTLDGVSRRGLSVIADLERQRFRPGAVAVAFRRWATLATLSERLREQARLNSCGIDECCPDPEANRELLELVLARLPQRDARRLADRLDRLDDGLGYWDLSLSTADY